MNLITTSFLASTLLFASTMLHAQTAAQAESFVRTTYARYTNAQSIDDPQFLRKDAPSVFSPSLLRLIRADQRNAPKGDVGKLDFDPICSCQDYDGLALKQLNVHLTEPHTAIASLTLNYPQPADIPVHLALVWTSKGWRINDIHTKDTPSLRKLLETP